MENTKTYAKECGKLSKKYDIPFEVALSLGPEHIAAFMHCINQIKCTKTFGSFYSKQTIIDYLENCPCRYSGLNEVICDALGTRNIDSGVYSGSLDEHISQMGMVRRQRICDYLLPILKNI